ncbi:hypothetical protein BDV10DRAFT_165959 [Aspergillus recurvatus]
MTTAFDRSLGKGLKNNLLHRNSTNEHIRVVYRLLHGTPTHKIRQTQLIQSIALQIVSSRLSRLRVISWIVGVSSEWSRVLKFRLDNPRMKKPTVKNAYFNGILRATLSILVGIVLQRTIALFPMQ